jgi:probable rRNA maturation factor
MNNRASDESIIHHGFAFECDLWRDYADILEKMIEQAADMVLDKLYPNHGEGEVSWAFVDDKQMEDLNMNYRSKNGPTNVLSFGDVFDPADLLLWGDYRILGDVILSFQTIQQEALAQNKKFIHHCLHLCIHGFLHLLGYDHQTDQDASVMEALETGFLYRFGIKSPYETEMGL